MEIRPYITFKGECQEAIDLYTEAFNTEIIEIMKFSDIPQDNNLMKIPESEKDWILQGTLKFGDNFIRVSDTTGELNDRESERLAIAIECSVDEVKKGFDVLSKEGKIDFPLEKTFFSPCHGVVYDKFGVKWIFAAKEE